MNERFSIKKIHICPFDVTDLGHLRPDLSYPTRFCVIDNEKEIAIDIKTKLKYDYIPTVSQVNFLSESYKKITKDKRVAVISYATLNYNEINLEDVSKIIDDLKNDKEFIDGNEFFNNQQYMDFINQEQIKEKNQKTKIKRKK